jgi:hypothetical protein
MGAGLGLLRCRYVPTEASPLKGCSRWATIKRRGLSGDSSSLGGAPQRLAGVRGSELGGWVGGGLGASMLQREGRRTARGHVSARAATGRAARGKTAKGALGRRPQGGRWPVAAAAAKAAAAKRAAGGQRQRVGRACSKTGGGKVLRSGGPGRLGWTMRAAGKAEGGTGGGPRCVRPWQPRRDAWWDGRGATYKLPALACAQLRKR